MSIDQTIEEIKMSHDAVQERLNKQRKGSDSSKNYANAEIKKTFHAVEICDENICYGIDYAYLRPVLYFRDDSGIMCQGDGYKFEIRGTNLALLFTMIKARAVARIVHGEKIEIGQTVINIESVTAEPLGLNDES